MAVRRASSGSTSSLCWCLRPSYWAGAHLDRAAPGRRGRPAAGRPAIPCSVALPQHHKKRRARCPAAGGAGPCGGRGGMGGFSRVRARISFYLSNPIGVPFCSGRPPHGRPLHRPAARAPNPRAAPRAQRGGMSAARHGRGSGGARRRAARFHLLSSLCGLHHIALSCTALPPFRTALAPARGG